MFLSSSSDGLVQNCVTISQWFSYKTAAFYTEQYTSPSFFYNFEVSRLYWSVISATVFKIVRMCTNHLATKPLFCKFTVEKYVGWSCVMNCFMLSS